MNARTQALVLGLFGAALLRLGSGDMLLRLVRPGARPWVLAAGAACALLACSTLVAVAGGGDEAAAAAAGTVPDAHGHRGVTRLSWLVLAPVVSLIVLTPSALGAFSADRQRSAVSALAGGRQDRLPAGSPVDVRLEDFVARAVLGHGVTLRGRTVRMTGFVASPGSGGFTLARLVITCCAADASPFFVRVTAGAAPAGGPGALARDDWVEVTGRFTGLAARDVPILRLTRLRRIAAPSDPYG